MFVIVLWSRRITITFSGLGEALAQDDIADKEEWFSFKKKEDKTNLETSMSQQERNGNLQLKGSIVQ